MTASTLPIILGLPLAGAVLILMFGKRISRRWVAASATSAVGLSFLTTAAALSQLAGISDSGGVLRYPLFTWSFAGATPLELGLLGDQLSLWFLLVITGVGALIHLYSAGYMADEPDYARYFGELNLFIFAMGFLVLSDNFIGLLIGWAAVGLASFLLIGFWRERRVAAEAAQKAFVINTIGDVGILLACLLLFQAFGGLSFEQVFQGVASDAGASDGLLRWAALLLLAGAAAKSAQLPLHTWLPDAMQGPTPVSALIHAATMVTAGVYLTVRAYPLYQALPDVMQTVAVMGGVTALFGAVMAAAQFDIKRVLAYSTMSQVGYMMLATGTGAYEAGLFHFLTHAFYKATLFLAAGLVIHHLGGEQDIRKMGGLRREAPVAYWGFLAGILALVGAPLFSGFFSKDEILAGALATGHLRLWSLGVVTAGFTAFYALRLFYLVFLGHRYAAGAAVGSKGARAHPKAEKHAARPRDAEGAAGADAAGHRAPLTMRIPVVVLGVLSVIGGWIAFPGITSLPHHLFEPLLTAYSTAGAGGGMAGPESGVAPAFNPLSMLATLLFAALGVYFATRSYGPVSHGARPLPRGRRAPRRSAPTAPRPSGLHRALEDGLYVDALYRALVRTPLRRLGGWCGEVFDQRVIDGSLVGIGRAIVGLGTLLKRFQSGYVRQYALTLFVGALLVLLYVVIAA